MKTFSLCALLAFFAATSFGQYPSNPQKPITYINRARSSQPGGIIIFDSPVMMNGAIFTGTVARGEGGSGSITSGTYLSITQAGIFSSGSGTVIGGTNSLSWGTAVTAYDTGNLYISGTELACYSLDGYGYNHTLIVRSSGLGGIAIVGESESGSPAGVYDQELNFDYPVFQIIRNAANIAGTTTEPALQVSVGDETVGPVATFKHCGVSGDNGIIIPINGSIVMQHGLTTGTLGMSGGNLQWNGVTVGGGSLLAGITDGNGDIVKMDDSTLDGDPDVLTVANNNASSNNACITFLAADGPYGMATFFRMYNSSDTSGAAWQLQSYADGHFAFNRTGIGDALQISSNMNVTVPLGKFAIGTSSPPASSSAAGTKGTITYDDNYIYVCTETNTWKRAALSTW